MIPRIRSRGMDGEDAAFVHSLENRRQICVANNLRRKESAYQCQST